MCGCGVGDIKIMLEINNFSGKCVDINVFFVGLCCVVGFLVCDIYGVCFVFSVFGYCEFGVNFVSFKGV